MIYLKRADYNWTGVEPTSYVKTLSYINIGISLLYKAHVNFCYETSVIIWTASLYLKYISVDNRLQRYVGMAEWSKDSDYFMQATK